MPAAENEEEEEEENKRRRTETVQARGAARSRLSLRTLGTRASTRRSPWRSLAACLVRRPGVGWPVVKTGRRGRTHRYDQNLERSSCQTVHVSSCALRPGGRFARRRGAFVAHPAGGDVRAPAGSALSINFDGKVTYV